MSFSSDLSFQKKLQAQGSNHTNLRFFAFQSLRLRAKKVRRFLLRRRWSPSGSLSSSRLNSWYGVSGKKPYTPYQTNLQTLYTESVNLLDSVSEKNQSLAEGKKDVFPILLSAKARVQNPQFSENLPTLEGQEGKKAYLLHKEQARFHARFYPDQKTRFPAYGCLHVTTVHNNCFLGITDIWGRSFSHASTGSLGFTQKQRLTHPAFALGMKMAKEAFQGGMKSFLLVLSGSGRSGSAAQAGIMKVVQRHWKASRKEGSHPTFKKVGTLFVKKTPHNGCRLPAQRRKRRKTKVRPLRLGI